MMPLTEAIRQTVITFATDREIDLVVTNSDGSAQHAGSICYHVLSRAARQSLTLALTLCGGGWPSMEYSVSNASWLSRDIIRGCNGHH